MREAIDSSKNHQVLLQRLYLYSISGLLHTLLRDYLTNKVQSVRLGTMFSEAVKSLVPASHQDSVLEPLFFPILYQ